MEFTINQGGIESVIETHELLVTSKDRRISDVPPTFADMLITFWKNFQEEDRERLRLFYPTTIRELDKYV